MRADLYDTVTQRIISELEQGTVPWVCPWRNDVGAASPGLPHNATTARPYSGINILLLWAAGCAHAYRGNAWLTYKQAQGAGGHVKKGERATTIFYADRFIPKTEKSKPADDQHAVYFLKSFSVFNADQCEGITAAELPALPQAEQHARAESVIAATGATIQHGGTQAMYVPSLDVIRLPLQQAFAPEQINYYRTAFHELGHWTLHPDRCNREYGKRFGDTAYAREELVAEMASAFVCASLGIAPTVRHADYLASWLSVLRGDNKAIFTAASHASKAADFILKTAPAAAEIAPETEQQAA